MLDKHGTPLQPTRPAMARKLLSSDRAVIHRHTPLVIRLKDRQAEDRRVPGVETGIDPGSKHTGLAVFHDNRHGARTGLFTLQIDHRGGRIRDRLAARAGYRRRRRSANRVAFDTHALSAGRPLEGAEYQQGTLAGYEVREYLLAEWGRACAYCGTSGVPPNIDHIHPRSRGGSDRISNLAMACITCNQAKNNTPVEVFLAARPKILARVQAQAKTLLRDAAAVTVLVAGAAGRGAYARTTPDRYGFPRLARPRTKQIHGSTTGDLVRADVPAGKKAGVHIGRVLVRSSGSFDITTTRGRITGINHRHMRLLQRTDGYAYTTHQEETSVET